MAWSRIRRQKLRLPPMPSLGCCCCCCCSPCAAKWRARCRRTWPPRLPLAVDARLCSRREFDGRNEQAFLVQPGASTGTPQARSCPAHTREPTLRSRQTTRSLTSASLYASHSVAGGTIRCGCCSSGTGTGCSWSVSGPRAAAVHTTSLSATFLSGK